jgi:hypothetical protein
VAITVPTTGTTDWDVPLNAVLNELDRRLVETSFNVTEYGAAGNGIADDTSAIQAAINAAAANGGGIVYLPPTSGGYLLDGAALTVTTSGITLKGAGGGGTRLILGANFTGATMVNITATDCGVLDLWFEGDSTTTTSNPVADAVRAIGVRRTRINRCTFYYINGWAIQLQSTAASSTSNPRGSQIGQVYLNECAGGVRLFGDTTQGFQMNVQITDFQAAFTGVASGGSANLDVIMIEDAWDVLVENAVAWMGNTSGTGSSLHIKGDCAASFITNFDGLGSENGPCVLIESDAGGFPQNVQITGGVIQQGTIGMQVTGTARHIRLTTCRVLNNQTHGISIENTQNPVYLHNLLMSLNGQGAAGSNYDINWSGTATGVISNCYFASPITSIGVAGVQQTINVAAAQDVVVNSARFAGTSAASTNWFTNLPSAVMVADSRFNFRTRVDFNSQIACQPSASSDISLSSNVSAATFDNFRLLGNGDMAWGSGAAARDTNLYRGAANELKTDDSLNIRGNMNGVVAPTNHNLVAWAYDPASSTNTGSLLTNGTVYLTAVYVANTTSVTKIRWFITNAGVSPVAGQNEVGIYNSSGSKLVSANVDSVVASTGSMNTTIGSTAVTAGSLYWVAFVFNAATAPTLTRGTSVDVMNVGLTASTFRFATNGTSQTVLPASITPASNSATTFAGPWAAIG